MANFLQNSIDGYRRGWEQTYGAGARRPGPAVVPVSQNPAIGAPIGAKESEPPPVAHNPAVGQPLSGDQTGIDYSIPQSTQPTQSPQPTQSEQFMLPLWMMYLAGQQPQSGATPMAQDPAMGAPLSGDDGSGSGFNFLGWLQNIFGGNQGPQYSATQNTPANLSSGGASGGGYWTSAPGMGQYYVGASPSPGISGDIYSGAGGEQAATAAGDVGAGSGGGAAGMGGAGGMGSSLISGLGSALSSFKNQPSFSYTQDNVPLPQKAQFVPPNLSPNQNAGF